MVPKWPPPDERITYQRQWKRCGKSGCRVCTNGGQGHGPYWYAYWRQDGRLRSRYIGKTLPADPSSSSAPNQQARTLLPTLRVRALGGFTVWRGAEQVAQHAWSRRKAAALFKCLLGSPSHALQRDQLLEEIWPDLRRTHGANQLRSALSQLRRILGSPVGSAGYIYQEGDRFSLDPAPGGVPASDWCDADAFAAAATRALSARDLELTRTGLSAYQGDYLPDDPYEEWAVTRREALQSQYHDLILHHAHLCAEQAELEEAEHHLRMLL